MGGAKSQGDGGVEKVSLDDVLSEVSLPSEGRELAPLTRVGYRLALFILAPLAEERLSALEILIGVNEKRIEILKEHDPAGAEQVALELEQQKTLYAERGGAAEPQH